MRCIAELVEWIDDEIEGSEKYASAAVKARDAGNAEASRVYYEIARQECEHAERLHDVVVSKIREVGQSGAEVPKGMMDVWEWKHDQYIARLAEAKVMLSLYQ